MIVYLVRVVEDSANPFARNLAEMFQVAFMAAIYGCELNSQRFQQVGRIEVFGARQAVGHGFGR